MTSTATAGRSRLADTRPVSLPVAPHRAARSPRPTATTTSHPGARTTRPGVHLTGRGYLLVLLVLVLALLGAFAVGRSASSHARSQVSTPGPAATQITVQQGDTLWSIARHVAPQRDPREVVSRIRRLNHLPGATVQAGRQLMLPALV